MSKLNIVSMLWKYRKITLSCNSEVHDQRRSISEKFLKKVFTKVSKCFSTVDFRNTVSCIRLEIY